MSSPTSARKPRYGRRDSVVQYSQCRVSAAVLDKAVAAVAKGGRHLPGRPARLTLLEEFQAAVELQQASDATERERMCSVCSRR